jgi:hypothetical protein
VGRRRSREAVVRSHFSASWIHAGLGALGILIAAAGIAACAAPSSSAPVSMSSIPFVSPSRTVTAVDAAPLTPALAEARLRTLDPHLTLVTWADDRDMGVYPKLVFRATTTSSTGVGTSLNAVLVYPTAAAREAVRDGFHDMSVSGPRGVVNWDGMVHSEWIGVENVLVEVVMPGGTFGGRTPTPSESAYPDLVRLALSGA